MSAQPDPHAAMTSDESSGKQQTFPVISEKQPDQQDVDSTSPLPQAENSSSSARKTTGLPWAILVIGLVAANLLISMDNTVVADIQAPIIRELGDPNKLPWISVGFVLGAASANIMWGQLHRYFDSKLLFLLAIVVFEVGRVVCGLGGTGVFIGVMNCISALTTPAERSMYVTFPGAAWAGGALIGPVIGGAINDSPGGWRWCFYLNVVFGGAWLPVYFFLLPSIPKPSNLTIQTRLRRLDILGFTLWTTALSTLVIAISFGGSLISWNSGGIIGLFTASGILWILLCAQQICSILTTKDRRLFPLHLMSRDLTILFLQTASGIATLFLPLYFIPLHLQFLKSDSALMAGVHLLPFLAVFIVFLLANGAVLRRTGLYMPWYFVGSLLTVLGAGLMQLLTLDSSISSICGLSVIIAAGAGSFIQASFAVAQAKVAPAEIPMAVAVIGCAQITGATLCFAVAYSAFLNVTTAKIARIVPAAAPGVIQQAIVGVGAQLFGELTADQKREVLQAILEGIRNVWVQTAASGGVCLVLAGFMKRERVGVGSGAKKG